MKRIALYLLLAALLAVCCSAAADTLSLEEMLAAEEANMTDDLDMEPEEAVLSSARGEMIDGIIALARQLYTKAAGKPQRAQYSGLNAEYFEKNRDKILKDAEDAATKQVRLWYVIDAIAAAEKIEAKDEEKGKKVIEFILANAKK